jgi:hypothetical protein
MTSWGRRPTDEQHAVPVTRRQSTRDPVQLRWCPILDQDAKSIAGTAQTRFEHRDRRLWSFLITQMPSDNPLNVDGYQYYILGSSAGCEPVRFVSYNIPSGKKTVERFANMPLDNYQILTADAEGTSDHPVKGKVALITIRLERRVRRSALPNDYDIEYDNEERTGRVTGSRIMLFPTQEEINEVLETALDRGSEIVERLIEELNLEGTRTRRQQPTTNAPMQRPIITGSLFTSRRQFGAAAAAMDTMCAPDSREERAIQL